jgi:hypothetical protein
MRAMVRLILVCLAVPILAAATILPEWQQSLNAQMLSQHDCEVNALSNVHLGVKNGKEFVSARVHCMDKRAFDVTRSGRDPYKIEACGPAAC